MGKEGWGTGGWEGGVKRRGGSDGWEGGVGGRGGKEGWERGVGMEGWVGKGGGCVYKNEENRTNGGSWLVLNI